MEIWSEWLLRGFKATAGGGMTAGGRRGRGVHLDWMRSNGLQVEELDSRVKATGLPRLPASNFSSLDQGDELLPREARTRK